MSNTISFPGLGLEFKLPREMFSIGPVTVYWYGFMITFGIFLAGLYLYKNARRFGLDFDRVIDVVIGGVIGAIIGARLYYVLFSLESYSENWLSVFQVWNGGLAIYGGIIGAFITGFFTCKWRKVPVLPMFDIAAIGLFIGQALGRWGNFFNIEAFGTNTNMPWGMASPVIERYLRDNQSELYGYGMVIDPSMPVHPTFLYESLWCIAGFFLLHFLSKKRRYDGQIFITYIGFYSIGRFFIEGLRTDSLMIFSLRVSQLVALITALISLTILIAVRSRIKREHNDDYLKIYADTDKCREYFEKAKAKAENRKDDSLEIDDEDNDDEDEYEEYQNEQIDEDKTLFQDEDEEFYENEEEEDDDEG